ncbi:hypothetical protein DFH09DRAFT_1145642 [Mycena vulgaris]|nr:hypothetical protein DFH09DRAFT_1145642 [Mycena vulgaris]
MLCARSRSRDREKRRRWWARPRLRRTASWAPRRRRGACGGGAGDGVGGETIKRDFGDATCARGSEGEAVGYWWGRTPLHDGRAAEFVRVPILLLPVLFPLAAAPLVLALALRPALLVLRGPAPAAPLAAPVEGEGGRGRHDVGLITTDDTFASWHR